MTINEQVLNFISKAQTKVAEIALKVAEQDEVFVDDEVLLGAELLDACESLYCSYNDWTDDDKIKVIEHYNNKAGLTDYLATDTLFFELPIINNEGGATGDYVDNGTYSSFVSANNERLVDIEGDVEDLKNKTYDFSEIVPQQIVDDIAYSKTKVDEQATSIQGLGNSIGSVLTSLNAHKNEVGKHLTPEQETAWNAKPTQSELTTAIGTRAAASHSHEIANINQLQETLNDLQGQIDDLPADPIVPVFTIGTVEEGETASATITGTVSNPILNLVIVKGDTGADGKNFTIDQQGLDALRFTTYANLETGKTYLSTDLGSYRYKTDTGWGQPFKLVGDNGWSPLHGLETWQDDDGNKYAVNYLFDWIGGSGTKPQFEIPEGYSGEVRWYLSSYGYSLDRQNAINIAGATGKQGPEGRPFIIDQPGIDKSIYDFEPEGFTFFDVTTGMVYQKQSGTEADWSGGYQFTGPQGVQGPQGADGPIGPQGIQGPIGIQGIQGEQGLSGNGKIGSKTVDETNIGDDRIPVYKLGTDIIVYEDKPTGGGLTTLTENKMLVGGVGNVPEEKSASEVKAFLGLTDENNKILTGLAVTVNNLNVTVTAGSWKIAGVTYQKAIETNLVLDAADATFNRFDLIVANSANEIEVIKGVASANPAKPDLPSTKFEIKFVLVTPTGTTAGDPVSDPPNFKLTHKRLLIGDVDNKPKELDLGETPNQALVTSDTEGLKVEETLDIYDIPDTLKIYLENEVNWAGVKTITASGFTNNGQPGQRHKGNDYFFECYAAGLWTRYPLGIEYVDADGIPSSEKAKLENTANWTGVNYTGTALAGCYAGQRHYNAAYYFMMVTDTIAIRLQRI